MANDISTIKDRGGVIAKLAAGHLNDNLQFIKSIDKADDADLMSKNGYKAGDTIQINVPTQFTVRSGATYSAQDIKEASVPLAITNQVGVDFEVTSAEVATDEDLSAWSERRLKPAMIALANEIERACLEDSVDSVYNLVGTAGSTTFDTATILSAGVKISESGLALDSDRFMLLDYTAQASAVNADKGLFHASEELTKQYKEGAMGTAHGFKFLANNLLPIHTNGNDVAFEVSTTVSTQGQSTLVVEGLTITTGTVKKGTVFTIAGVNKVHPVTKADLGVLQQFVVTADATADGSGIATLSVSPAMYTTGSQANISAFPADGDTITPVGSASTGYKQNLGYHKSAFRFVSVPLVLPEGTHMAGQNRYEGISVRVVADYDITNDKLACRADVLYGFAKVRPEWACRITA